MDTVDGLAVTRHGCGPDSRRGICAEPLAGVATDGVQRLVSHLRGENSRESHRPEARDGYRLRVVWVYFFLRRSDAVSR